MKIFFLLIFLISLCSGSVISQVNEFKPHIPDIKLSSPEKTGDSNDFLEAALITFPFNPILLIEDKRFYAGITKDISFGSFPYGRISLEYSLIFRSTYLNQIRASYNYDIGIEAGDLYALIFSIGGGYFTDFRKTGYFPQAALSMILPVTDNFASLPYIKVRETFMTNNEPDIFDFSFGFGMYVSLW